MATLPTLEQGGSVYRIQLWSTDMGGLPFVIGTPESPNVATPAFEARLWEFAQALAADFDVSITAIRKFATADSELAWPV